MLKRFSDFIRKEELFSSSEEILLAVSGGVDSVVMCEFFHRAGFRLGIAHCNFKLREKESDDDEQFVKRLSEKYKAPFYAKHFDTKEYSKNKNISIQMAARELRYSFFEEVRKKNKYSFIATAHHKNDVVETMLLNLARGTGISGLHGIFAKRDRIIRPLLFATRDEIEKFARESKISFREDSSNESEKYQRNLIRKKIVPVLRQINPALENTFAETALRIRDAEKILSEVVDGFRKLTISNDKDETKIQFENIMSLPFGKIILFELLMPFGFSSDVIGQIYDSSKSISGKQFLSSTHRLTRDRKYFIITPLKQKYADDSVLIENVPAEISFNGELISLSVRDKKAFAIPQSSKISCLDLAQLKFPLTLRSWKEGDHFKPFGMKNKKKISDFLVDIKMPLHEKENVKVIVSDNKIICIPSLRIDNEFRITERTTKVLVVKSST